jgi:hypothetical protein
MTALLYLTFGAVIAMIVAAIMDLVSEELRARLDRVPVALLRLAALRMPKGCREGYLEEWQGELREFLHGDEALPVTRLAKGIHYAGGILAAAGSVRRGILAEARGHRTRAALGRLFTRLFIEREPGWSPPAAVAGTRAGYVLGALATAELVGEHFFHFGVPYLLDGTMALFLTAMMICLVAVFASVRRRRSNGTGREKPVRTTP